MSRFGNDNSRHCIWFAFEVALYLLQSDTHKLSLLDSFKTPGRIATFESILSGMGGQVMLVISGILAARLLGVEGRGYFSILVIIPGILCQIGTLGLPQAITHHVATDQGRARYIHQLLRLPCILQAICLIVLHAIIISLYVQNKSTDVIISGYLSIMVIPGLLAHRYALAWFQGLGKFRIFNVMRLLPVAVYSIVLLLIVICAEGTLPTIVFGWGFVHLCVGFVALFFAIRSIDATNSMLREDNDPSLKDLVAFGLRGLFGSISLLETFRIDQLVAGFFLSPAMLGLYVVAQSFMNLPCIVAQSIAMILYPLTSAARNNWQRQKKLIMRSLVFVTITSFLIIGMLIFAIPFLLPLLFGSDYSESVPIAQILLVSALFLSIRRILVEGLRGLNHPIVSTYAELSIYPVIFITTPIILHSYSIEGLAMLVVLAQVVALLVAFYFWKRISCKLNNALREDNSTRDRKLR